MSIQLVRLDDRLIHGQVVAGWVKSLMLKGIVVIDDEVAQSPFQESLMRMAVPEGIDVEVFASDSCNGLYKRLEQSSKKTIVLFSQVSDIFKLFMNKAFPLHALNLGGVGFTEGREQLAESLFLSPEEIQMLADLANAGVYIELRPTPFDRAHSFHELLKLRDARLISEG
ncbi:MAG: PTS sugar transporter subunit IIB [Candidatus Coatesbacteria bacterium]|nr:PTS sugar transporter subunit IIB [Candidatus Coatesbacteria bacterium]